MNKSELRSEFINGEINADDLIDMIIELDVKVKKYTEVLNAVAEYTGERKELSLYLESINDYVKTALYDIENTND